MADVRNIEIKISDGVSSSIGDKLKQIGSESRAADAALKALQDTLSKLNLDGLKDLLGSAQQVSKALKTTTTATKQLADAQDQATKAQAAATKALDDQALAQVKLNAEQERANKAKAEAEAASVRLQIAETRAATATQELANAAQRGETEASRSAKAMIDAEAAALRLDNAQKRAARSNDLLSKGWKKFTGVLKGGVAALAAALSVRSIMAAGDAYQTLTNRLRGTTDSQAQLNHVTNQLYDIAARTRQSVSATADAFISFDRSLGIMGKSQRDTLKMTETLNKVFEVNGASADEAKRAMSELSKAFNTGTLTTFNMKSILETVPALMDAVADSMGIPIDQLQKMTAQGQVTGEVLFDAFSKLSETIDNDFGKTIPTISTAMQTLKDRAAQFFGSLGQGAGISTKLAQLIELLANNLDKVAMAAAGAAGGVAFLFAPQILAGLGVVTTAIKAMTVAVLANPILLLATAIVAGTAYLVLFRDQIKLGTDDVATLGDFFRATFEVILAVIDVAKTALLTMWQGMIDAAKTALNWVRSAVTDSTGDWAEDMQGFFDHGRTGFAGFLTSAARTFDAIGGLVWGLAFFAGEAMVDMTDSLKRGIFAAYDQLVTWIETVTNMAITAANSMRSVVGMAAIELVQFDRLVKDNDVEQKYQTLGERWAAAIDKGFSYQGGALEETLNSLFDRAEEIGRQRRAALEAPELRGGGLSQLSGGLDDVAKSTKDSVDEIQRQYERLRREVHGPLEDFRNTQVALALLLKDGTITQQQHAQMLLKATEAYKDSQDPLRQYNKNLDQQISLLKLAPKEREIESQIMAVQNDLLAQGIVLGDQEIQQIRDKLQLQQQLAAASQLEQQAIQQTIGKRQDYIDQLEVINKLLKENAQFTKEDALSILGSGGVGEFIEGPETLALQLSQLQGYYDEVQALRDADLISEQTASAARFRIWKAGQDLQLATSKQFFSQLEGLQSSSSRELAAIGKAAAITNAVINTYQAATGAYAAMASIPYVGPALGAAAAGAAVAIGLENVAQIRAQNTGFKTGGFTGSMGVDDVAGVVHGQEYVMDANTTSRIGVQNLDALRSGAAQVQKTANRTQEAQTRRAEPAPAPVVNNQFSAVVVQSKEAALAGLKSSEGQAFIIETLEENSSTVAKIAGVR